MHFRTDSDSLGQEWVCGSAYKEYKPVSKGNGQLMQCNTDVNLKEEAIARAHFYRRFSLPLHLFCKAFYSLES